MESETNHGVNKLHTVIFRDVMGGSDHKTDSPAALPLRAECSQEANTEDDRVKEKPVYPTKI